MFECLLAGSDKDEDVNEYVELDLMCYSDSGLKEEVVVNL